MQPTQKKIMTMVKVSDSCAADQSGNSCAMGVDRTLQAYTMPTSSRIITPMTA